MERICTFTGFGKGRQLKISLQEIVSTIQTFCEPGGNIKAYSVRSPAGFWKNVCSVLDVSNTLVNRMKIRKAVLDHQKRTSGDTKQTNDKVEERPTAVETSSLDVWETGSDDDFPTDVASLAGLESDAVITLQSHQCCNISGKVQSTCDDGHSLQSTCTRDVWEKDSDEDSPTDVASLAGLDSDHGHSPQYTCTRVSDEAPDYSTDSSDTEDKFFRCGLPQQPCAFFIDRLEWQRLRESQKGRLFRGLQWTNVIAKGLRTVHPYCSFGFKRHCVKTRLSKTQAAVFKCSGHCCFSDCPVNVDVRVKDETTLKATVVFSGGDVCHNVLDLKRRPVRADARMSAGVILETKLPRTVYLESLVRIPEEVMESGCRDDAPTKDVLKTITASQRKLRRRHSNEILSLEKIFAEQVNTDNQVLQKVLMQPKGVMLWSQKTLGIFHKRCREDIVYLDATGSVIRKETSQSPPFYVYELVVRNPSKGASPLPVASYVTCDHTTASVTYFLQAFQTDLVRMYGVRAHKRPVMIVCDGSMVLLQSLAMTFCKSSLDDLLHKYHRIVTGQHHSGKIDLPILHRCLSHIMKNAKDLCKKQIAKHYKLGMHTFGLLACSSRLKDLDEVLLSMTVIFCSPCTGKNTEKHLETLHVLMAKRGALDMDDEEIVPEDYKMDVGTTPLMSHFQEIIDQAPLDLTGEVNTYHAPNFVRCLAKHFLPHATLWSGLMLGDLGRHGTGPSYHQLSQRHNEIRQSKSQNYTQDNRTQGIMEKSQWDLKTIRLQRRRFSRLDDFVQIYQQMHDALLREYADMERSRKKSFRVEMEKWRKRSARRKGIYVSPLLTRLPLGGQKRKKSKEPPTTLPDEQPEEPTTTQGDSDVPTYEITSQEPTSPSASSRLQTPQEELNTLWKKKDTEVVVAVLPCQIRGSLVIHHSELKSLQPHKWLIGEAIEGLLQVEANQQHVGKNLYILNHYTAGVILFGKREQVARQSLSKVNLENFDGIVSFVNISNVHWNLLYINAVNQTVYLVDPAPGSNEEEDSKLAAAKLSEYLKMRRASLGKTEWIDKKWKGGVLTHPLQQDSSSCGVIVIMMARAVMKAFPAVPVITFGTSRNEMATERQKMALQILKASVFDLANNCAMCSLTKPPGSGPPLTNWIQCDDCGRWFHEQCLGMDAKELQRARAESWSCCLCA